MHYVITYFKKHVVTSTLLTINLMMVFIMLIVGWTYSNLVRYGGLIPDLVTDNHEYYRLITVMFLHGDIIHFLSNSLVLLLIGGSLENILGPYRYSIVYFISGLVASVSVVLFAEPDTLTVGASGAIFGIIGALLILTFTKPKWFTQQGIKSIRQLMIINLVFTFIIPFISILAHVGGLIAGSIIIYFLTPDLPYYVKKNPMYLRRYKVVEEKTHYDA